MQKSSTGRNQPIRRLVICLFALILLTSTFVASGAARITVFAPETSTVEVRSTARESNDVEKRVDALFEKWDKPDSPGCALGVIKDGKLIYSRGYGKANLEHAIPISGTIVFDIGSTSKQFTAASIVLLSQQGKLSLEDDVRKFITELPDYDQPSCRDYPVVEIEWRAYRLVHFWGDRRAPPRLHEIEATLDRIAGTRRWLGDFLADFTETPTHCAQSEHGPR